MQAPVVADTTSIRYYLTPQTLREYVEFTIVVIIDLYYYYY